MSGTCSLCSKPVRVRTRIFQISFGQYFRGAETPTYQDSSSVLYEGHESCFDNFSTEAQREPYRYSICNRSIRHRANVIYGVVGSKPALGYKRPERRGHEMPFIAHISCWEREPLIVDA
jgi:hypothetical protein